ncbi:uroporphyrinogen decarboxylase family protein [Pseudobacteroides cellulosolvens]|uniref:Uroporphyrinogen decarboxylase (URO-D) n=1 Tax=Pseudobacteroides cellulosolvens ATCC 35603 = DSM 2933 TaxID=398512 RepID=A0A0L6JQ63_9FIRM|nr:uroporphyrinogen decarboxylase family protein [Pseudobacteroides cellulosolvens]KNY27981.1 Uroporphyrinogen decarboxylase (URO-D) [Pseudobacteroides cellulosolvens ATCC 35603 = DSM 2933]
MNDFSNQLDFICSGESMELIPDSIVKNTGIPRSAAHTKKDSMALVSDEMRKMDNDTLCRLPFCVTVEAEAIGGDFRIGEEKTGPVLQGYKYKKIEELADIKEIDLEKGRIKEVLDAVSLLKLKEKNVVLNVEGPFTIIALLIDSMSLYKGIKNRRDLIESTLQKIEDSLFKYILEGVNKGADIISYADPTGDLGLVGPKIYREISGKHSYNLLKRVEGHLDNSIIHLCGKTSIAFEKTGFCVSKPVEVEAGLTYGEAIIRMLGRSDINFVGHRCLRSTPLIMKKPAVWKIELA